VTGDEDELQGIQRVACDLGITPRTLRFYEDKGLIEPQRVGTTRIYTRREVARMQLILRGKRLGFSLKEIKLFLDLYDADPQHVEQMRALAGRARERADELEHQRRALDLTISELHQIEREALDRVRAAEAASV
jgi:DNA-binding transcriptional MerR regulator